MNCFDFDEDETLGSSAIVEMPPAQKKITPKKTTGDELTVSQIQALLRQEQSSIDSTVDSSMNESSIYTDEQDSTTAEETLTETCTDNFYQDDESSVAVEIPKKKSRKPLGAIENRVEKYCNTYIKSPKTQVVTKTVKTKTDAKNPKKRKVKKIEEDENFIKYVEQINKQFEQVEKFQLSVEKN